MDNPRDESEAAAASLSIEKHSLEGSSQSSAARIAINGTSLDKEAHASSQTHLEPGAWKTPSLRNGPPSELSECTIRSHGNSQEPQAKSQAVRIKEGSLDQGEVKAAEDNESVINTPLLKVAKRASDRSKPKARILRNSIAATPTTSLSNGVTDTPSNKPAASSSASLTNLDLLYAKVRPKSSIPTSLSLTEYAQQCVQAAYASRLNPYALHPNEQELLEDHLCHLHVTTYLNIRNGILRLWTRNAMLSVTEEEALGCAKDVKWMPLAMFAYNWLVRNGYINFGCVEPPRHTIPVPRKGRRKDGPTIVVIGAGMAGLGASRQLRSLFQHYHAQAGDPKIIILEGRKRIGGRIYSQPLSSKQTDELPPDARPTAELGAHIIVGFEHGNPLDPILRAQLALRYHLLKDVSTLYDVDGNPVDELTDAMSEKLYYDILERAGAFRRKSVVPKIAEGDNDLIDAGRDVSASASDGLTIKSYEDAKALGQDAHLLPTKRNRRAFNHKTPDVKTSSGVALADVKVDKEVSAAQAAHAMGWSLKPGVLSENTLALDKAAAVPKQTLGSVMDTAIHQYQDLLPLEPQHMRLLNWHFANLEYANAANLGKLSLSDWDQDMGNEFEGEHAQVIGGYQQVPRALYCLPERLDVRTDKVVKEVNYAPNSSDGNGAVLCEDGTVIRADKILVTAPLGVLKNGSIKFNPPLPDWKTDAIQSLGYGNMNKVILVFEKSFWDVKRDMFGLLREPTVDDSLNQADYRANRGRFYLFWNCIKTSGLPMLIALMAGDAAHQAEKQPDAEIIAEVMAQLRKVFKDMPVPDPIETIITRWGLDRFSQGTYSYVAANALPEHYDLMAKPVGNLFFAGEATCRTHPATVHGAYLSGLRAASEIAGSIVGPVPVPVSLNLANKRTPANGSPVTVNLSSRKRKAAAVANGTSGILDSRLPTQDAGSRSSVAPTDTVRRAYDAAMSNHILAHAGPKPVPPKKLPLNPFLLYQKHHWGKAREEADRAKSESTGLANARASRDEVRVSLGSMWRHEQEHVKKPYVDQIAVHRAKNDELVKQFAADTAEWDRKAKEAREKWLEENPLERFGESMLAAKEQGKDVEELGLRRKRRITG